MKTMLELFIHITDTQWVFTCKIMPLAVLGTHPLGNTGPNTIFHWLPTFLTHRFSTFMFLKLGGTRKTDFKKH